MNILCFVGGISFVLSVIFIIFLVFSLRKSAKQADKQYHEAFLEEVEKIKEEHKDE